MLASAISLEETLRFPTTALQQWEPALAAGVLLLPGIKQSIGPSRHMPFRSVSCNVGINPACTPSQAVGPRKHPVIFTGSTLPVHAYNLIRYRIVFKPILGCRAALFIDYQKYYPPFCGPSTKLRLTNASVPTGSNGPFAVSVNRSIWHIFLPLLLFQQCIGGILQLQER